MSDKQITILAIFGSILLHALFLFFPLSVQTIRVDVDHELVYVPIKLTQKRVSSHSSQKANPLRYPGDRLKPQVIRSIKPIYPKSALNQGWRGKVVLNITVNYKGGIRYIKVVKSSGFPILDQSFVRTVKRYYKFKPKRIHGKNIQGRVRISYTFK